MASASSWPALFFLVCGFLLVSSEQVHVKKYCIIGAGAAGIQVGHNFKKGGLDYVTLERGDHAGWFFKSYPIHRKLISINRRNTRSSNPEFNLRHDWNSLLGVPVPPFTNWTDEYFPDADVLVEYLKAAAVEQEGAILYKHNVSSVQRTAAGFEVSVKTPSGPATWQCTVVIAATGLWRGFSPTDWLQGMEHATGYEELSPWPGAKAFDKISVMILGNGNAAFETADAVRNFASDIGILGRRAERQAQDSHYVGDVRGPRTASLDSLQLKSLDDVFNLPPEGAVKVEMFPCAAPAAGKGQAGQAWPEGKWDTELRGFRGRPPVCFLSEYDANSYLLAAYEPDDPIVAAALKMWPEDLRPEKVSSDYVAAHNFSRKKVGNHAAKAQQGLDDILKQNLKVVVVSKEAARRLTRDSEEFRRALPALIGTTEGLWIAYDRFIKPYDLVVRALGWRMQDEPFKSLNLTLDHIDKYPKIDACFKAQDGFYFAGTLTHGYDKFRYGSAGGFIHGFRYTSKSLYRCLVNKYEGHELWSDGEGKTPYDWAPPTGVCTQDIGEGVCSSLVVPEEAAATPGKKKGPAKYPAQSESVYAIRKKIESIPHWSHMARRINEASGPYQMSCGALVDGLVYNRENKTVTYVQDMPLELFDETYTDQHRIMWMFRYGLRSDVNEAGFLRTRVVAFASNFLHPVLFYIPPKKRTSTSYRLHMLADRWTDFAGREDVLALEYFMREVEKAIWENRKPPAFHERYDNFKATCDHHTRV